VSGWSLIIFLLLLGGLISTFGDLVGTKIGKARFSILKLRPKKTATLITIITGSLISASSLSLMILVNRQLRVGLFRLGDLQKKLQESRQVLIPLQKERETLERTILKKEREFKELERKIVALRRGNVVIRSGQSLMISEVKLNNDIDIKTQIELIVQKANRYTQKLVKPNIKEPRGILLLRNNHIEELEKVITQGGSWIVNIKSVRNVLSGENYVYAFPELTKNKIIVKKGEIITEIEMLDEQLNIKVIRNNINLLLSSSLAELKRRGSLANEIKLRSDSIQELRDFLKKNNQANFKLEAVSIRDSKTAEPVAVELNIIPISS